LHDFQPSGIVCGDVGERWQEAFIGLNHKYFARSFHQQAARQTAGAWADFNDIAGGYITRRAGNAPRQIEVEDEVLAKFLIGPQFMLGDDIAKRR